MKFQIFLLAFTFSFFNSSHAQVGDRGGNGGDGIVCGNTVRLLDSFESERNGLKPTLPKTAVTLEQKIEVLVNRIRKIDLRMTEGVSSIAQTIASEMLQLEKGNVAQRHVQFVDGELYNFPDEMIVSAPRGCEVKQLVVHVLNPVPYMKDFNFSKALWSKMSQNEKAYTILHEAIFAFTLRYGPISSSAIRWYTGLVISDQLMVDSSQINQVLKAEDRGLSGRSADERTGKLGEMGDYGALAMMSDYGFPKKLADPSEWLVKHEGGFYTQKSDNTQGGYQNVYFLNGLPLFGGGARIRKAAEVVLNDQRQVKKMIVLDRILITRNGTKVTSAEQAKSASVLDLYGSTIEMSADGFVITGAKLFQNGFRNCLKSYKEGDATFVRNVNELDAMMTFECLPSSFRYATIRYDRAQKMIRVSSAPIEHSSREVYSKIYKKMKALWSLDLSNSSNREEQLLTNKVKPELDQMVGIVL